MKSQSPPKVFAEADSIVMELTIQKTTRLCHDEFHAFTRGYREQMKNNVQKSSDPAAPTFDLLDWINCQVTKLELFANVLGVFAKSKLSVEHRLRANPAAKNAVLQLLKAILTNTRFCTKYVRDGSEVQSEEAQFVRTTPWKPIKTRLQAIDDQPSTSISRELYELALQRVDRDVANVLEFAASIRNRGMQQYKDRSRKYIPQDQDGIDLVPYFKKVVDKALEEQYTKSKIVDHEALRRRIENTIFDRWLRLCYSIHRHEQLRSSGVAHRTGDEESQQSDRNGHDGTFYSKEERPAVNNVNDSGEKVATTHQATTFSGSLYPRVQEYQPQSSAPSVALTMAGGSNARIPRLKTTKTACDGEVLDFFCPMCRLPQQVKSGIGEHEQHRAWKYDAW
jgi:hypothetical protein